MPSHQFEPQQTIYTLQNTPRKNSEQLAALGKYARPPISRFNLFSIAAAQTGLIFSTRWPKWLGAGCQSWCHIIQHVLHWSESDAPAYFLLSYGSWRDLDSYTNSKTKQLDFVSTLASFLLHKLHVLSQGDLGTFWLMPWYGMSFITQHI